MGHPHADRIATLLARYSDGELGAIDELVASEYFVHVPTEGEPSATETYRRFAGELKAAAPDLRVEMHDLAEGPDGVFAGTATIGGTWTGELWNVPPTGQRHDFEIPVRVRPAHDGYAFEVQLEPPGALAIMRALGLVNPPEQMHLPPAHPAVIPDFLMRVLFTRQAGDKACSHLADVAVVRTDASTCQECEPDAIWPALRMCLTCGHVGCCDTATHKHAKAHWEETGHPLIRSIRMDEAWIWCYEDNAFFESRTLEHLAQTLGETL
jgi:predicted ester cyclase